MSAVSYTRIDEKSRTGGLSDVFQPGEIYQVDKPSACEVRFRLMVVEEQVPDPVKLAKVAGFTVGVGGRKVTMAEIAAALNDFP